MQYSSAVRSIPNSNIPNSKSPNFNASAPNPVISGVQNSVPGSVQNAGVQKLGDLVPDVQMVGSNSVDIVDSEMSVVDDPPLDASDLSLDEVRALRRLISPANIKRIGVGRSPGDHSGKLKSDLGPKSKSKKYK